MVYQGSKDRLSKDLVPIIQKYIDESGFGYYLEPFVGGANVIDKISCTTRAGSDVNTYLIELLKYIRDNPAILEAPEDCSFEYYKSIRDEYNKKKRSIASELPDWYIGLIGFCASYGGRFFDGGYGRDATGKRNIYRERLKVLRDQSPHLRNIVFENKDYREYSDVCNAIIYCDPPYFGTKQYGVQFEYQRFYEWCRDMSKNNIILISEYNMPDDFECIWEKERKVYQKSDRDRADIAVERLFIKH